MAFNVLEMEQQDQVAMEGTAQIKVTTMLPAQLDKAFRTHLVFLKANGNLRI